MPAEQDGFGQRTGVIEVRRSFAFTACSVDEGFPVVHAGNFGPLVFLVLVSGNRMAFPT